MLKDLVIGKLYLFYDGFGLSLSTYTEDQGEYLYSDKVLQFPVSRGVAYSEISIGTREVCEIESYRVANESEIKWFDKCLETDSNDCYKDFILDTDITNNWIKEFNLNYEFSEKTSDEMSSGYTHDE
jgi:hypothetical protein